MRPVLRGPRPWAVILCRFSDIPAPDVPRHVFYELVSEYGGHGLFDYWQDVSRGNISTTGSEVFGWYTMQYSFVRDSIDPLHNAADTTHRRIVWINEARRLAAADGVDLSAYHGVIAVINASGDSSNAGTDMVANVWGPWGQKDWRWCSKCQGLAFAGGTSGRCPVGGSHDHQGSSNYSLAMNMLDYPGQPGWKWCSKCQGLAYTDAGPGVCPAGGAHDHEGSAAYRVGVMDVIGHYGQHEWRWCRKCQGLAYNGGGNAGPCPAGGSHDHSGSSDYSLASVDSSIDLTYTAHETAHGYGIEHSWSARPDTEYGDPWDIMSAMAVRSMADPPYANVGPGLNAPKLHKMGWLPEERVRTLYTRSTTVLGATSVRLDALTRSGSENALMARIVTADRIYTVEYRQPAGWDRSLREDAVLIHELRSHYTVGQNEWRWCSQCQALFFAGWAACAAGGLHEPDDAEYFLSSSNNQQDGQSDWRWCRKCSQLAFAGLGPGPCSAGGQHDHGGSLDYKIATQAAAGRTSGWRWCRKCQTLTSARGSTVGACVAGGEHNHMGSAEYHVANGTAPQGQRGWRSCRRCRGMFWIERAPCAAGGAHRWWQSWDYSLATTRVEVAGGQSGWKWCNRCYQLAYTGGGAGVCSAGGGHNHDGSWDYVVPMERPEINGQANWRWCRKCQTLAFGGAASPGSCPAGAQHDLTGSANYVLANFSNDKVYLVGGRRQVGDVFDDEARNVHITVDAIDTNLGIATVRFGHRVRLSPRLP